MPTELIEQITACAQSLVKVKPHDRSGGTRNMSVGLCKNHCGPVIFFSEPSGHNTDNTLMPTGLKHNRSLPFFKFIIRINNSKCLLGDPEIEIFPLVILQINAFTIYSGLLQRLGN